MEHAVAARVEHFDLRARSGERHEPRVEATARLEHLGGDYRRHETDAIDHGAPAANDRFDRLEDHPASERVAEEGHAFEIREIEKQGREYSATTRSLATGASTPPNSETARI
jgi:hypothetical protein